MSKKSAGKGKALLESLGLPAEKIEEVFINNGTHEEAVQNGLKEWIAGGFSDPTWRTLLEAMKEAEIAIKHHDELKAELLEAN